MSRSGPNAHLTADFTSCRTLPESVSNSMGDCKIFCPLQAKLHKVHMPDQDPEQLCSIS